jgi:hypothetical protein
VKSAPLTWQHNRLGSSDFASNGCTLPACLGHLSGVLRSTRFQQTFSCSSLCQHSARERVHHVAFEIAGFEAMYVRIKTSTHLLAELPSWNRTFQRPSCSLILAYCVSELQCALTLQPLLTPLHNIVQVVLDCHVQRNSDDVEHAPRPGPTNTCHIAGRLEDVQDTYLGPLPSQ